LPEERGRAAAEEATNSDRRESDSVQAQYAPPEAALLDPNSSLPLYYQLYRVLKRSIQQGTARQGDRFPSEEAIAATFGVSRPTANRAVEELVGTGWLTRERGKGAFVQDRRLGSLALLSDNLSLTEQFPAGASLETEFVSRTILAMEPGICELLRLPEESPILHLRRLRSVDGHPVMVCDAYLPQERFAELVEERFVRGSLYATLEEVYGLRIDRSERKLSAQEIVDRRISELLRVPMFSPILLFTGLTFVRGEEKPIEYMVSYVRESVAFSNTVRRRGSSPPPVGEERGQGARG